MFPSLLPIWTSHKLQPTEKIDDDMCPAREAILICFQEMHVFAQLQWNQMASLMQIECQLVWDEDHGVWFEQTLIRKNTMIGICPKHRVACDYVVVNKQGELKVVITVTIRQCPITGLKRAPSAIHLRHSECTKPADKSTNQFHWNLC